jgi:hypothetical protein
MSEKTASNVVGHSVLGRGNAQRKSVHIPEWGGDVLIQQMSGRQVNSAQALAQEAVDAGKGLVKDRVKLTRFSFALIRDSWINEDGSYVLSDIDYDAISDEPHAATEKLIAEIRDFNGLDPAAAAQAKKNSATTQNGASGTS